MSDKVKNAETTVEEVKATATSEATTVIPETTVAVTAPSNFWKYTRYVAYGVVAVAAVAGGLFLISKCKSAPVA